MQKSLYRVSVDIKVGAEYEKTITYGDVKVTAVRVLSVELVVNDVLVL